MLASGWCSGVNKTRGLLYLIARLLGDVKQYRRERSASGLCGGCLSTHYPSGKVAHWVEGELAIPHLEV
jgi:hypothetical protein